MNELSFDVTKFLDNLNHPLRKEIELLRGIILSSTEGLTENIKWNGPNYCFQNRDRITMKIQPPKNIQLILHCGVKKQERPKERIIPTDSKLLLWKENDRAIATFNNIFAIKNSEVDLIEIVKKWIKMTK